jgi:hypothetical protein
LSWRAVFPTVLQRLFATRHEPRPWYILVVRERSDKLIGERVLEDAASFVPQAINKGRQADRL